MFTPSEPNSCSHFQNKIHVHTFRTKFYLIQEEQEAEDDNIGEAEPDTVAEILDREADTDHPPDHIEERMED